MNVHELPRRLPHSLPREYLSEERLRFQPVKLHRTPSHNLSALVPGWGGCLQESGGVSNVWGGRRRACVYAWDRRLVLQEPELQGHLLRDPHLYRVPVALESVHLRRLCSVPLPPSSRPWTVGVLSPPNCGWSGIEGPSTGERGLRTSRAVDGVFVQSSVHDPGSGKHERLRNKEEPLSPRVLRAGWTECLDGTPKLS